MSCWTSIARAIEQKPGLIFIGTPCIFYRNQCSNNIDRLHIFLNEWNWSQVHITHSHMFWNDSCQYTLPLLIHFSQQIKLITQILCFLVGMCQKMFLHFLNIIKFLLTKMTRSGINFFFNCNMFLFHMYL